MKGVKQMKEKIKKNKERGIITMKKQRKKLNKRNNSYCFSNNSDCPSNPCRSKYCDDNRTKWNS